MKKDKYLPRVLLNPARLAAAMAADTVLTSSTLLSLIPHSTLISLSSIIQQDLNLYQEGQRSHNTTGLAYNKETW